LGSNGITSIQSNYLDRQLRVFAIERFQFGSWFNEYACLPPHLNGIRAGAETVTIDVPDATFDDTNAVIQASDQKAGVIQTAEGTTLSAVAYTATKGTATPPTHQRYWPYWVKSWTDDDKLFAKCWRWLDTEPDDSDAVRVATFDAAGAQAPAPGAVAPTRQPGLSGLGAGHLSASGWLEYASKVRFRRRDAA
jgi:hypothetical protein